jgi:acyl-CoA thioesterase FadM
MASFLRTLWNVAKGWLFSSSMKFFENVWSSRVLPMDVGLNFRMSSAGFLQICEQARWYWMTGVQVVSEMTRRGMTPVVVLLTARHFESLCLFEKFEIHSRIVHVGEKGFYALQTCIAKGKVVAKLLVKYQILFKNQVFDTVQFFHELYPNDVIPILDSTSSDFSAVHHLYSLETYLLEKLEVQLPIGEELLI